MRIAILGGGPAGLYFAILMKRAEPGHDITVYERNQADDTFGFGVVFSDQTLETFERYDRPEFRGDHPRVRLLAGHRDPPQGHGPPDRRQRVLRLRPAHPADAVAGSRP